MKFNKIITYAFTLMHLYLFTNFVAIAINNNISLVDITNIYENNNLFVIVLSSQIIFIFLIIYKLIYHTRFSKLKKN